MALNFPDSPTNGQIYEGFYWDNTAGIWKYVVDDFDLGLSAAISNTPTDFYTDGFTYNYVEFLTNGTLTVTRGGYADVLLVGGGGSGGSGLGAGGGAGGVLYIENAYLPAGSLDVVIGNGGESAIQTVAAGANGKNGYPSSLWKYYVPGGGGGGGYTTKYSSTEIYTDNGSNGASGGGESGFLTGTGASCSPGSGVSGLGNAGGSGASDAGGGGGGAGTAGADATTSTGGDGGDGVSNSITGSAVTYGGGGSGSGRNTNGSPGAGGGGQGGGPGVVTSGGANTGGGGGAAFQETIGSGAGGSGIVIVRWKV
jgi:hypothetical protein